MSAHDKLIAEARRWRADRARYDDAVVERYDFTIEPDAGFYRVTLFITPMKVWERLTAGEANRLRLELSDWGFKGKVVGRT